jgi:outer membrane protein assembly factor BamB
MRRAVHGAFLAALLAGAGPAADWTGFRGPAGAGVSPEAGLPVRWGKEEGLRWKAALPGRGLSNPVIAGGRVYVTACSGYREKRLHVLCLDEATGEKKWERQFTATGNTGCNPMTNMAAPTPVTDGKAVYALFATGDLAALGRDGTLLWYRSLVSDYPDVTNQVGMAASPVLAGGVLCLPLDNAGDSFVAGLDARTGRNLWKIGRDRTINWVTPLVVGAGGKATVVFQTEAEALAVDPQTGKVRWRLKGSHSSIPSPAQGEGLVFLTGGELKAVRPRQDGSEPEVLWKAPRVTGGYTSPVYYRGLVYGVADVAAVCVGAADGKERWRQRIDGPFVASPVIGDGKLYAVNRKGRTYVVALGEKPKVLARNDLDDEFLATPAIANGSIYLRSDKYLYCVGAKKEK